jgi:hypothetical protein
MAQSCLDFHTDMVVRLPQALLSLLIYSSRPGRSNHDEHNGALGDNVFDFIFEMVTSLECIDILKYCIPAVPFYKCLSYAVSSVHSTSVPIGDKDMPILAHGLLQLSQHM